MACQIWRRAPDGAASVSLLPCHRLQDLQKLLRERSGAEPAASMTPAVMTPAGPEPDEPQGGIDVFRLIELRDRLREALGS